MTDYLIFRALPAAMTWNPDQYLKFAQPRLRPALDLLARIELDSPAVIYDLGCGTGSLTQLMAARWPQARVTGVDDSGAMLKKAEGSLPNLFWHQQDLAKWAPATPADLIYSNAALHWLPAHEHLFPALLGHLKPGGVLAVQMPRNFLAPSHTCIAETVLDGPWRARLEPLIKAPPVAEPAWYFDQVAHRCAGVDIWETEYLQVLEGTDPVKEWTKGTWLKTYLDLLGEGEREAFEAAYAKRVAAHYPQRPDGKTLFPFRRLFMLLRRGN